MGAIAEFERDLIRERTRAGLDAARTRGRVGGRRRKLSAADIEAVKAMVRAGQTPAVAAERLGVSLATLYRYAPAIRDSVQVYRPRLMGHRLGAYAASAAMESWSSRMALGGLKPCRSISQLALYIS